MANYPKSDEREQLLDLLLGEAGFKALVSPSSIPVSREKYPRLSYAQARLWFLNRLEPWDTSYNVPATIRINGRIDPVLLERAINELIMRHDVLHTNFRMHESETYQFVRDELHIPLPVVDLTNADDARKEALVKELITKEIRRARDLERDPLVDALLIQDAPESFVLIFNIHHIITDGWSMNVIFGELSEIYRAFEEGVTPHLPEMSLQYKDYAAWQRDKLSGNYYQGLLDYWRVELQDAPALLDLPTDRRRPARQTHDGNTLYFDFGEAGAQSLKALCDRYDATEYMVLLAVFSVLLHRFSGQDDMVIGSPIANRNHQDLERLVGFFANSLAIRLNLSGAADFSDLIEQVKRKTTAAYDHQDMPFEKLVDELGVERRMGYSPVFQVMFIWQNATETHGLKMGRHSVEVLRPRNIFSKFDLTLSLEYEGERLEGWIEYSTDLFLESTVQRFIQGLRQSVESVLAEGRQSIGQIELMSADERDYIVRHLNDTASVSQDNITIIDRFEAQVAQNPDAPAVRTVQGEWSYGELDRQANRIAHCLRARGLGIEDCVVLLLERSYSMIATVLGVLKAGCTYVPADPSYPLDRIYYMLASCEAKLVITSGTLDGARPSKGADFITIDDLMSALNAHSDRRPAVPVHKDNLAYVIYTSGSTGQPKGIGMPYRSLDNLIAWFLDDLPYRSTVLQFASLSFDVSFEEIFGALCAGSCLYVVDQTLRSDIYALAHYVERERVERLVLPVVVLQRWVEKYCGDTERFANVREIITTGDALMISDDIVDFFRGHPHCRLINHYGPAETHVVTAYWFTGRPDDWMAHNVAIGKPIMNATVYVLDEEMRPLPLGAKGEIYIGGDTVARGYFGRPALTAERFVPDPFSREPGGRLYRTGDLARFRDGGEAEYIGRNDDMLKIRGHRVEPGEVQRTLLELDVVGGSYVVVTDDGTGDRCIVAYVTARDGLDLCERDIFRRLKKVLPNFMLPRRVVVLDAFPLTVNGKVDKSRLPAPPADSGDHNEHAEPATVLEEVIAGVWGQHLGVASVSVNDNFFEIGGHSLRAANVINDLRDLFDLDMPVSFLFEHQSVRAMAEAMMATTQEADEVVERAALIKQIAGGSDQELAALESEVE